MYLTNVAYIHYVWHGNCNKYTEKLGAAQRAMEWFMLDITMMRRKRNEGIREKTKVDVVQEIACRIWR